MHKKNFEDKYLKHNFFWIEGEAQAKKIQKIFIEFGFLCHTGKPELITWNRGFNSLVTFQPDRYHKTKYFQKGGFYCPDYSYGQPVNYQNFIKDYNDLKINENKVKELKLTKQMKEEKMEIQKYIKLLGLKAEDLVTGRKGIVTSIAFDLYGCIQAILTTQISEVSNESNQEWYDVARLKILNKKPIMKQPNFNFGTIAKGEKGGLIKPLM